MISEIKSGPKPFYENAICSSRAQEMDKYGRNSTFPAILNLLDGDRKEMLGLTNHALAIIDDVLDNEEEPIRTLDGAIAVFSAGFNGTRTQNKILEETGIGELGRLLGRLSTTGARYSIERAIAKHTYHEILDYWDQERTNLQRRWSVLPRAKLEELACQTGALVASQMLFIIEPRFDPYEFRGLTRLYGQAVKAADNLCDFTEDILHGFLNISLDKTSQVMGIKVESTGRFSIDDPQKITLGAEYVLAEYARISELFAHSRNLMLRASLRIPMWDINALQRIELFDQFCRSWLKQTEEFVQPYLPKD